MRASIAALSIMFAASAQSQTFDDLTALYRYDPTTPLELQQKPMDTTKGIHIFSLSYALPNGGRMPGLLVLPDKPGRKPAVVWMHSGGPMQFLADAIFMAQDGAVSLIVGEAEGLPTGTPEHARDQLIADVIGLRRAADLLEARPDVDRTHLGSRVTVPVP